LACQARSRSCQPCSYTLLIGKHTLIVEEPGNAMNMVPIEADTTEELFRIGREMFPGRRLAAVNHEDEGDEDD